MTYPTDRRYSKDHEWIRLEDGAVGVVGITHHAQAQLGDVVFVELPEVGRVLGAGEQFGSIESVKAVSDLYCPAGGKVLEVNTALVDQPEQVNQDPHGVWMIRLELQDPAEVEALLDATGYGALVA